MIDNRATNQVIGDIAIRCLSITRQFGSVRAVDNVSLNLSRGRILALLGPSGCGKTTTLRMIAGFEVPDAGRIEIGGRVVAGNGEFVPPERRKVGMVFQDYALFPHFDVGGNVAYGLPKAASNGHGREAKVKEMLSLVGLSGLESRMPHELSGGQQQRVALARALVSGPEVVLLDEPFSNLDAALRTRVRAEVRQILKAASATAVFVTHDQEEALGLADEVALMLEGQIVQLAEPEILYHRPATREVATFVGDADFLPGQANDGTVSCELGQLRGRGSFVGSVDVMLRPENIGLVPIQVDKPEHRDQYDGEVVFREFFGHDQLLTVRLISGRIIRSRTGSHARIVVGDRVKVSVWGDVTVFKAP